MSADVKVMAEKPTDAAVGMDAGGSAGMDAGGGRLDEGALRRPGFDEAGSIPITLADGQEWHFPRPRVRFVRERTETGFGTRFNFGPDYERLIAAWRAAGAASEAEEPDAGGRIVAAQLALAEFLILINYDLSLEQIQSLIQFEYGDDADPASTEAREAIMAVAFGNSGPKRSAAGST